MLPITYYLLVILKIYYVISTVINSLNIIPKSALSNFSVQRMITNKW